MNITSTILILVPACLIVFCLGGCGTVPVRSGQATEIPLSPEAAPALSVPAADKAHIVITRDLDYGVATGVLLSPKVQMDGNPIAKFTWGGDRVDFYVMPGKHTLTLSNPSPGDSGEQNSKSFVCTAGQTLHFRIKDQHELLQEFSAHKPARHGK